MAVNVLICIFSTDEFGATRNSLRRLCVLTVEYCIFVREEARKRNDSKENG